MELSKNTPRKSKLREEVKNLKKVEASQRKQLNFGITLEDVEKFLESNYPKKSSDFWKTQLNLLNKSPKGSRYTDEYKRFALGAYFLGPKMYRKISEVIRFPSKSTLQRFTKKWVINPGFNDFIFKLTELRVKLMTEKEKDCIICLDEMSLKSHLFYDISKDKVVGFQEGNKSTTDIATTALVVMARGVAYNWKQPIAYFFFKNAVRSDEAKEILIESVRKLSSAGLNILGVVSDQGSNFRKLVKVELGLTNENPCFMVDNIKLVYLYDVPHLLKSIRNNLFSYSFHLQDGHTNKKYIETMYNHDKSKDFRLCPKLTNEHIYPNSFQKMKVKYAAQVLSHSTSVALHWFIDFKLLPESATTTANFVEKINHLFDLFNSSHLNNVHVFRGVEKQIEFLEEMIVLFKDLKVYNEKKGKYVTKTVSFISGWQMTIKAVLELWKMLKEKGYTFFLTRHLNQDCLENFFGQIRNCSGNSRNPTPIQFCRAFKKMLFLKYFNQEDTGNCMKDFSEALIFISSNFPEQGPHTFLQPAVPRRPIRVFTNDYQILESSGGNALIYIAGYLLFKSAQQHSCDTCDEYRSLDNLKADEKHFCDLKAYSNSKFEGLTVPPKSIVEYVTRLENIFVDNFNTLAYEEGVGSKLKNLYQQIPIPHPCENFPGEYLVSLYTRARIYFALKFVNREIKTTKTNKPNVKITILQNL